MPIRLTPVLRESCSQLVAGARKVFVVIIPILVVLILYVSWLILR